MRPLAPQLAFGTALIAAVGLFAAAFSAEPPLGSLEGRLVTAGGEQPLRGVHVTVRPKNPKSGLDSHSLETDENGYFEVDRLPAGEYEVEPLSEAHQNKTQPVTIEEGKQAELDLALKPGNPYLNLNVHSHAFLPDDSPKVSVQGFRQGDAVQMRLLAVDDAQLLLDNGAGLRGLLTPVSTNGKQNAFRKIAPGHTKVVREWEHRVKNRNGEGVFYDFERLGKLKPGIYLVEASGSGNNALGWMMVTDLALVTKSVQGSVLAFATDLRAGTTRPGVQLTFFNGRNKIGGGTTDAQGLATVHLAGGPGDAIETVAKQGDSLAYSRFFPYGYSREEAPDKYRVHTYTDRPVYRPGHLVHYKGLVRVLAGTSYAMPSAAPVQVDVTDEQGTSLYEAEVPMSAAGSFAGEFHLPGEAMSGVYTLRATVNGEEHSDSFSVASYRKPEWKVEVESPRKSYVRGETVPFTIHAQYYYGAPVVEGKVTYTVYRAQHWSYWDGEEEYADEEQGGLFGDEVVTGEAITDQDGSAHIQVPTNQNPEDGWTGDYNYTVMAEVADMTDRTASGQGTVRVSAGELVLEARSDRYVAAPGDTVGVTIKARNLEDQPAANVDVQAEVALELFDGRKAAHQQLSLQRVKTDEKGQATIQVTLPKAGLVLIKLETRDRRGNKIESSTDVWVSSADGGDYATSYPALSIVPDKKLYHTGETAQLLINTDKPGATAMVALEGDGLLEYRTLALKSKSTVVRFKIKPGYEPDVFATVCFVKNREFVNSEARLNVNAEAHRLDVRIESDRETYHPGDTATFKVHTTGAAGKPRAAEISFGLVDEAIYAIKEDPKDGLWNAFYPLRQNSVLTQFSYPEIYLGDADKDGGQVAVRKNFPDTAYWQPTLRTNAQGEATVSLKLPDNLTSWRATVRGITDASEVGERTFNVQVQKELTLRLQVPRSLTEGDHFTLSAVAHNYSQAPLDVTVDLKASGVQVSGGTRRVHLNAAGAERVDWDAIAGTPGQATVTATATGGAFSDGMQLGVPVLRFAREAVQYNTGAVADQSGVEKFNLDPNAVDGEMELRLSPSLAGTVVSSLEYLATYPHGCTEQTMSSFLPDVVIQHLMGDLEIGNATLKNQLPAMTEAGLLRLYHYQHSDGGWGWWEYDDTEPWMTAYVLFGMQRARESKVELNDQVWQNGVNSLKEQAKSDKLTADDGMFVAYVLTEAGQKDAARDTLARFEKQLEKMQRRSLGYRALALLALGEKERAQSAIRYLWSIVNEAGGMAHWEEKRPQWSYGIPQDVESTAVILKAALAVNADDPRLSGVVRWLLLKRNGNHWVSTRDTAFILYALGDYLRQTNELKPNYHLSVVLNGKEIHADEVTPADALRPEDLLRVPLKDLRRDGGNQVEIRRAGSGTAYYAMKVTQAVKTTAFSPESSVEGLTVSREYFRVETRRDAAGRLSNVPGDKAIKDFKVGDRVMVRLTIRNTHPMEYLILENPLPSGCEVQDRGDLTFDDWRNGGYWWSHQDVRDDRINLFIRDLPASEAKKPHVIEFYLRPEMAGQVKALPAVLSDMYNPALRASTAESSLEVRK